MARGCVVRLLARIAKHRLDTRHASSQRLGICQPLAADIPSAADLEIKSRAEERPGDPPLPPPLRTETVLKRDEWMLMPETTPVVPASSSINVPVDDDPMDGYGEPSTNTRTTGGAVDFFSSLGTERKKKPQADKPDPDKASHI